MPNFATVVIDCATMSLTHTCLLLSTLIGQPPDAEATPTDERPRDIFAPIDIEAPPERELVPEPGPEPEPEPEVIAPEPEPEPEPAPEVVEPPPPAIEPIPRLFETLQSFRPSEVASHTNADGTVTFVPGIQLRNQVGYLTPFTIDRFGNEYHEGVFTSGRLRLNPVLRLGKRQNVEFVATVDIANGRWAPRRPDDPIISEIVSPNPDTVAHGIAPMPMELLGFDLREFYVQWNSKIGQFRAGQMAFTWGEGILASSGNWADRFGDMRFGSDGLGKIYERFMFATRPFKRLGGVAPNFIIAIGGDLVFRDDRVDLVKSCEQLAPRNGQPRCDIAGQGFVVLRYEPLDTPGNWIGGYAVYRHQQTRDDGDVYLDDNDLEVGVGDIAGQGSYELRPNLTLLGGFEAVLIGGRTTNAYNENGDHRILQGGGAMRGYIGNPEVWLAGFDAGYASGDANPADNKLTGFTFDTSAQVGLVLFPAVRGWRSAQSEILATNGELTGVPLNGTQFIPTRGAVTNAIYIHPKARWSYAERFEIWGGPLIAMAATPDADPYTTRLNGGDPTNSVGGSGDRRYYGTELDLGMRGRIDIHNLWFQLGLQGGLLLPGKGLANAAGTTDGPTAALWVRTEIRY